MSLWCLYILCLNIHIITSFRGDGVVSDPPRDLDAHDDNFNRDQSDDDPLQRIGLVRRQHFEEELGILLDQIELELDLSEAVPDLEFVL